MIFLIKSKFKRLNFFYLYDALYITLHLYGRLTVFPETTLLYVRASVCMQVLPGLWLPGHFLQLKQINAFIYISLWELGY